jgi:hypothetical protein
MAGRLKVLERKRIGHFERLEYLNVLEWKKAEK